MAALLWYRMNKQETEFDGLLLLTKYLHTIIRAVPIWSSSFVLKLGALAGCFALFLLLIKDLMLPAAMPGAGLVYVALVWAFKIFNEEERALFRRVFGRNG